MKKQIIAVITVAACVALCASVWPRSAEVESLPAEPVKTAVNAEIEARSSETPHIFISEGMPVLESKPIAESNSMKTEIMAEKETEKQATMQTAQSVKPTTSSSEPYNGDVRFIDGEKQIYLLVFGWIKDEGGGSVGTMVGNPNDQLTGHKVGIMGGGTTVDGKGDINKMVGIMGSGDDPANDNPVPGTKNISTGSFMCGYRASDMLRTAATMSSPTPRTCMSRASRSELWVVMNVRRTRRQPHLHQNSQNQQAMSFTLSFNRR